MYLKSDYNFQCGENEEKNCWMLKIEVVMGIMFRKYSLQEIQLKWANVQEEYNLAETF